MKYVIASIIFFLPSLVFACSFAPEADIFKPQGEVVGNYTHAFVGYIGEREEKGEFLGGEYELTVREVYKGGLEPGEVLDINSEGHSCGFFHEGNVHGVFLFNELNTIGEETPKKLFNTEAEALSYGNEQFQGTKTNSSEQPEIPEGCTGWYDGCNNCGVENGELTFCTLRACFQQEEPYCTAFEEEKEDMETPDGEVGIGPEFGPEVGWIEPTTQPPYDNTPDFDREKEEKISFWTSIKSFFTSLFNF